MNFDEMPSSEDAVQAADTEPNQDLQSAQPETDPSQDALRDVLKEYWALKPTSDCIDEASKKVNSYYSYLNATGKMASMRGCFEQYNRGFLTLGSISRGGLEGELMHLPVNEFRSIGQHVINMTTQEKLSYSPQPINSDFKTGAEVTIAKSLLEYYSKHKGMEDVSNRTEVNVFCFGEGHVLTLWNENLGDIDVIDPQSRKIYKKGDIQYITLNPTDVIRDIHVGKFEDNSWFICRLFVNKYELAAQYPDKAEDIVEYGISSDWDNTRLTNAKDSDSDLVPMYVLIHKPTSAVPFGRMVTYLNKDCWLQDGHLKYRDFPLVSHMPSPVESVNFGYTIALDMLPLQQMLDILNSAIATNNTNFAVTNILVPEQCNLGVADIIGSMNLLKYNPQSGGKPEALNLTLTPQEVYNFRDYLVQRMQVLAGVNDVVRGVPEASLKSASALALMASQALHFNSMTQKTFVTFQEQLGNNTLHMIQDFADVPRIGLIAGNVNQAYLQEFSGKTIEHIDRVMVSVGSAFAQSAAGRLQIAQDLLSTGLIKDPQEYIEVLETGSLDRLVEGQHSQLMLIKKENELLAQGQKVQAIATDDHVTHILEHQNVLANPQLRTSGDPMAGAVVTNTLAHIQDHIQQLQSMGPILAAVLKQPVIQAPGGPAVGAPPEANGQMPKGTPGNPEESPKAPSRGNLKPAAPTAPTVTR